MLRTYGGASLEHCNVLPGNSPNFRVRGHGAVEKPVGSSVKGARRRP